MFFGQVSPRSYCPRSYCLMSHGSYLEGLQSATLALSRRQDKLLAAGMKESDDCHPMKKQEDLQMSSSNIIPEAKVMRVLSFFSFYD